MAKDLERCLVSPWVLDPCDHNRVSLLVKLFLTLDDELLWRGAACVLHSTMHQSELVAMCLCIVGEVAELVVVVIAHIENQEKNFMLQETMQVCKALNGMSISFIVQIFY